MLISNGREAPQVGPGAGGRQQPRARWPHLRTVDQDVAAAALHQDAIAVLFLADVKKRDDELIPNDNGALASPLVQLSPCVKQRRRHRQRPAAASAGARVRSNRCIASFSSPQGPL